jgi:hypothetical protein
MMQAMIAADAQRLGHFYTAEAESSGQPALSAVAGLSGKR